MLQRGKHCTTIVSLAISKIIKNLISKKNRLELLAYLYDGRNKPILISTETITNLLIQSTYFFKIQKWESRQFDVLDYDWRRFLLQFQISLGLLSLVGHITVLGTSYYCLLEVNWRHIFGRKCCRTLLKMFSKRVKVIGQYCVQ